RHRGLRLVDEFRAPLARDVLDRSFERGIGWRETFLLGETADIRNQLRAVGDHAELIPAAGNDLLQSGLDAVDYPRALDTRGELCAVPQRLRYLCPFGRAKHGTDRCLAADVQHRLCNWSNG